MNRHRIQILIAIAALVALPAATWLLGISPLQQQISGARAQTATAEALNNRHGETLDSLKSAASNLTDLKSRLATLEAAVPADPDIAVFLAEVGRLGKSDTVSVIGFTAGTPQSTVASAATPASSTGGTSSPASSSGTTAAGSAMSSIPVTLQVQGTAKHVRTFVGGLQTASRLFVVTSLSITSSGGVYSAALSGNAFVAAKTGASVG